MEALSIVSTTVSEMLIQSHEGKIRIFPAVTSEWEGAFVLGARGAFIVSSEIDKNKGVSFVGIESIKGNPCKLQNPWNSSTIVILNLSTNKKVKHKISEEGLILFSTEVSGKYLIVNGNDSISAEKTFTGKQNKGPKYFNEAILGSKRDF